MTFNLRVPNISQSPGALETEQSWLRRKRPGGPCIIIIIIVVVVVAASCKLRKLSLSRADTIWLAELSALIPYVPQITISATV